ncbi:MAG TPA: carboxypeptidase regulatory-like domain-containing protein [bacterium]|nr:carboxypeptidase regulatory-like domain-containing protein [bacterium]
MKQISLMLILLSLCIGCATQSKYREKRRPFDPAEYAFVKLHGTSNIHGQIFVPRRTGGQNPCSGCEITLNPATVYSEEFYLKTVKNNIPIEEADLRVLNYIRKTISDDSGRFVFKNIGEGKYYLYSPISYDFPKPGGGYQKINAYVYQSIYIREGQTLKVELSR